jgi:hypothetical protein
MIVKANKNKDEDKYTKNLLTKNYVTHEHKEYEQKP